MLKRGLTNCERLIETMMCHAAAQKYFTALTHLCSSWPYPPVCSVFWWVQVGLEGVSQQAGALASFWPFHRFLAQPSGLSLLDDRLYASSDWCPPPCPPGNRSLLPRAAEKTNTGWGNLINVFFFNSYFSIAKTILTSKWEERAQFKASFSNHSNSASLIFMWQLLETRSMRFPRQKPEALQTTNYAF